MESNYTSFVDSLSDRYPTLTNLSEFLRRGSGNLVYTSSIQVIDIDKNGASNKIREMTLDEVLHNIRNHSISQQVSGMIVLLEDPGPIDMERLGTALDINPLFFGGHVATAYEDIERKPPPPLMTMCPSLVTTQNFIHIHCQKVVDLGAEQLHRGTPYKLIVPGNIPRQVRRMQALSGRQLGLIRTCTSIYLSQLSQSNWVCLILLDSSTRDITIDKAKTSGRQFNGVRFPQIPRRIRAQDVRKMPSYSSFDGGLSSLDPTPASLLQYLADLFKAPPPGLQICSPDILSLAYYPLRIALAEWMLYCFLMSGYVKYYEYTFKNVHQRIGSVENQDFMELHRWRRRSKQSLYKLQLLQGFVEYWQKREAPCERPCVEIDHLLQDIQHIIDQIKTYSESLESKGPIITTMIQILDSRRSIEEAVNVGHLTYIALVFIPLSYIASIFSMGDDYGPGKDRFWIYFATALPLSLLILAVSRFFTQFQVPWSLFQAHWNPELTQRNRSQPPV